MGDARQWKPSLSFPVLGGAILFENHVAIVVGILGDYAIMVESNYSGDGKIDVGRAIKINDPSIRGYLPPASWKPLYTLGELPRAN